MKANYALHEYISRRNAPVRVRPIGLGISVVVIFVLAGCASQKPAGVTHTGTRLSEQLRLEPGTIGVAAPRAPAAFSFHQAKGQIESAGEVAGNFAHETLNAQAPDPLIASAVGFAVAPFAAAVGAISAKHNQLTSDKLAEAESDLVRAMTSMAEQRRFRDIFLHAATEKTYRRLLPAELMTVSSARRESAGTVLETKIEELRLERTGASDESYALRIEARVRLVRTADGSVLYDQSFEYQSGRALFLDWTIGNGFQNVVETGYRQLAERMIERLLAPDKDGPMLLGAGHTKPSRQEPKSPSLLVANKTATSLPASQFVDYRVAGSGAIGIYSTAAVTYVAVQRPLTKDGAVAEAVSDVEWSVDGLNHYRNPFVALPAMVAAIPVSLWKQTAGAVRGVSRKEFGNANAQLSKAAYLSRPHDEVAFQVAQQLAPKTSQAVALVKPFRRLGDKAEVMPVSHLKYVMLDSLPPNQTAANFLLSQGIGTALEIRVLNAVLKGKEGINPPLALCVEAQATLVRTGDGQELYSCPVHYRSAPRKFTEWAAHEAELFHQEMETCSRELGGAIVDQLVSRQLIAPDRATSPVLAATH